MQSKLLGLLQPDDQCPPQGALSEEVVFHSPVKDYHGCADVGHILSTIRMVLDQIDACSELTAGREVVTIMTASHRGQQMTGVLHETHDTTGRIDSATLLLRPLSTLREAISDMVAALDRSPLPSSQ
jgi:hypothetical protein